MHLKGITSTEKRGIVTIPHSAKRERIVTWIDNRGSTEDVKEQIRGFIWLYARKKYGAGITPCFQDASDDAGGSGRAGAHHR